MRLSTGIGLSIGGLSVLVVVGFLVPAFIQTSKDVRDQQMEFARRSMEIDGFEVEDTLLDYIHHVERMADCPEIQTLLEGSNAVYAALDPVAREARIATLNTRWMNAPDDDPLIVERMTNDAATYLLREQSSARVEVGEIFLTDSYGVTVATTGRLTTLAHAQKYWWQAAYDAGEGRPFIDDRGYDTSVGAWVIGVVVPIYTDGAIVGVVKVNYLIESLLQDAVRFARLIGTDWNLTVARSDGTVLASSDARTELPAGVTSMLAAPGGTPQAGMIDDTETLFVWVPVRSTITVPTGPFGFGGSAASSDHSAGNSGEHWVLVSNVPAATLDVIARRRLMPTVLLGLLMLGAIVVSSFLLSRQLTRRLARLQTAVLEIDPLDPQWPELRARKDEVSVLAAELQALVARLRRAIVEKDELLREQRVLNESLVEKDTLIKEVNHRVKNNLLMVTSLIRLKERAEGWDLSDVRNQVNSIQLVHEFLYRGDALDSINFHAYASAILDSVFAGVGNVERRIDEEMRRWDLPSRTAVTLGLILNEVATNAQKHGFEAESQSRFLVSVEHGQERVALRMSNTGRPLPKEVEPENSTTLGLQLIRALTEQLDGTLVIEREPITAFVVVLPADIIDAGSRSTE